MLSPDAAEPNGQTSLAPRVRPWGTKWLLIASCLKARFILPANANAKRI